jgi:hypothetical protein
VTTTNNQKPLDQLIPTTKRADQLTATGELKHDELAAVIGGSSVSQTLNAIGKGLAAMAQKQ